MCSASSYGAVTLYPPQGGLGKQRRMQAFMGRRRHKPQPKPNKSSHLKHRKRCGALCCSSRPSVSSASSSEGGIRSSDSEQLDSLSNLAHGMVQARLAQMITESGRRRRDRAGEGGGVRCIVLIAMDKRTRDPRGDFRTSMLEVITSKGLSEPKELRSLLNCYLSMNPWEHRLVILETFYEVCSTLFRCSR